MFPKLCRSNNTIIHPLKVYKDKQRDYLQVPSHLFIIINWFFIYSGIFLKYFKITSYDFRLFFSVLSQLDYTKNHSVCVSSVISKGNISDNHMLCSVP